MGAGAHQQTSQGIACKGAPGKWVNKQGSIEFLSEAPKKKVQLWS